MLCEILFSVNLRGSGERSTNPPTQCSITFLNNYSGGQQKVASLGQRGVDRAVTRVSREQEGGSGTSRGQDW